METITAKPNLTYNKKKDEIIMFYNFEKAKKDECRDDLFC